MKKYTVITLILIILLITGIILLFPGTSRNFIYEIQNKQEVDIVEHSQQYTLLYSLNLQNSITPQCNWENTDFEWEFPENNELTVYKTAVTNIELVGVENFQPLQKKTTYENIDNAIDAFFKEYPEIKDLSYDYEIQIFSDEKSTYEKMPLFTTVDNLKILTSNLGVWKDLEGKYIAGLYEISNEYKEFSFNEDDPYFTFLPKSEQVVKESIEETAMKFLNHAFLCEDNRVEKKKIESAEIVYINIGEYLFPVYKVIGSYTDTNISWTALVNPVDYTRLDYTIYVNSKSNQEFIPLPFISNIALQDDTYYIEGMLPNKLEKQSSNKTQIADSFDIQFIAKEQTGEYIWETRKHDLQDEITNSLQVDTEGKFEFNFRYDNFWKVEKIIYEDDFGNELETPMFSTDNEIERNTFDNWFQIKVCIKFDDKEYCTESSKTDRLDPK